MDKIIKAVAYLFLFAMAICVYFLLGGFTFWYVNIKLMGAFFFDTSLASIFGVNLVGWTIWYTLGALINFKTMCIIAEEAGV